MATTGFGSVGEEDFADRIYEAAVLPEFWPQVLGQVAHFSGTAWSTLVSVLGGRARWVVSSAEAEEIVRAHFDRFGDNMRTTRLLAAPRAGFITDYDILTQEEIDAEPLYQSFLIPRGFGFGVGSNVSSVADETVVVHCEGRYAAGPIRRDVVSRLDSFRPHLARSALLSTRLAFERARTAVETLSAIGLAACSVSPAGAVLVANAQFEKETALWTTRGANRIALHDHRANRQLYDGIAMIGTENGVRSMPVVAKDDGIPAVLHLVPIRRAVHDLFGRAAAIMVLTKASSEPTQATPLLQALFDLSPAEAAIAARIAAGRTTGEIARLSGKSIDTVRNQLKNVLKKTGCRRQADLARLLAQLTHVHH